jgi:hypothetical protein
VTGQATAEWLPLPRELGTLAETRSAPAVDETQAFAGLAIRRRGLLLRRSRPSHLTAARSKRSGSCSSSRRQISKGLERDSIRRRAMSRSTDGDDRFIVISLSKPLRSRGNSWNPISRVLAPNPLICRHFETVWTREQLLAHAEGRGFESLQPLQERPAFAGLFVRAVGWCVCVIRQ